MELIIFRDAREAGRLRLSEGTFSIGRGLHNTIALDDQSISRRHARLHVSNGHVIIQDLGSINGTLLNGSRVREAEVDEGDALVIGPFSIEVRMADEDVVYHDGLDSTSPGSRPEPVRVSGPVLASKAAPPPPIVPPDDEDSSDDEGMHPHDFLGLGEEDWSENVPTTPLPSPPAHTAAEKAPKPMPTRSRSSVKIDPSALSRRPDGRLSLVPRLKPPTNVTSVDSADFIFEADGSSEHDEEDIFPQMPTEATTILRLPNTVDLAGDGPEHASAAHAQSSPDGDPDIPFLQIPPGMARQPTFQLGRRTFYIGRAEEADIVLLDSNASRRHACIAWEDGAYLVKDLWSLNGILVNEARVTTARLHSGDRVRVGDTVMTFVWKGEPAFEMSGPASLSAVTGSAQLPPPPHPRTTPALPAARAGSSSGGLEASAQSARVSSRSAQAGGAPVLPAITQADLHRPEANLLTIGRAASSPALPVSSGALPVSGGALPVSSGALPVSARSVPAATPRAVSAPASSSSRHGPTLIAGIGVAVVTFAVLFLTRSGPETPAQGGAPQTLSQAAVLPEGAPALVSTAPDALIPAQAAGSSAPVDASGAATSGAATSGPSTSGAATSGAATSGPSSSGASASGPSTSGAGEQGAGLPSRTLAGESGPGQANPAGARAPEPILPTVMAAASTLAVPEGPKPGGLPKGSAPLPAASAGKTASAPEVSRPVEPSPKDARKTASGPSSAPIAGPSSAPTAVASKPPKAGKLPAQEAPIPAAAGGNDLERRMSNQYQAGQAAVRQGKLQEAIRLFQRALQEDPDRTSELYYQIEEDIETTRARLNDQVRPLVAEARSLAEAGQLVEAHQRLQEAIARAPDYQPAAATLKQIQTELDRQGNRLLSSAQAKEQAGNKAEAQGLYRQVLSLFPDRGHPMHQKAAARLEKLSN